MYYFFDPLQGILYILQFYQILINPLCGKDFSDLYLYFKFIISITLIN